MSADEGQEVKDQLGGPTWRWTGKLPHPGDVHRARYCPADSKIIATKTQDGDVCLWNREQAIGHTTSAATSEATVIPVDPISTLVGSTGEGFALQWSTKRDNYIASGGEDKVVCVWDVTSKARKMAPLHKFKGHKQSVEDVDFHYSNQDLLASASADGTVRLWDLRKNEQSTVISGYPGEVTTLAFHPKDPNYLLCGGSAKCIQQWDIRNTSKPLHTMVGHDDEVLRLQWAPWKDSVIYSVSRDKTAIVWDLSRAGRDQDAEDAADGPPELVFSHRGHRSVLADMHCSQLPWVVASCDENNVLQVWAISEDVYEDEDDDEEEEGDEEMADDDLE